MKRKKIHTLIGSEARWRTPTLVVVLFCWIVAVLAFLYAWGRIHPGIWVICAAVSGLLFISNARYFVEHKGIPTVGMLPVSVASVAPAFFAAALATPIASGIQMLYTMLCLTASLISGWVVWGLIRLRAAYTHAPLVEDGAAVIVLGAAVRQGQPCRTLVARVDAALAIWRTHRDITLVLTGGPAADDTTTEAEAMESYLLAHGVPKASMVLETCARNTEENIAFANTLLDDNNFAGQRCVLSSDYHLYRALVLGKQLGYDLIPIPVATLPSSRLQQWCREVLTVAITMK